MKLGWRGTLGIVLSVAFLAWALHGVPWVRVIETLRAANLPLFLASAATATLTFPLRARRWRTILDPIERHIPFGKLWRSTAIGMMINNVVPARAGEIARAYALTREAPSVAFPAAFASLAVDRLFDALVLLLMMFAAMLAPGFPTGATVAGRPAAQLIGGWGTLAIVVLLGALYMIVFFPARIISLYEAFSRRVAPRFEEAGRNALLAFAAGLSVLRSPSRFAAVMFWTVLHWLTNALAFWLGFKAVGLDAPFSAAVFLQSLIAIGVALPAAPGFFGVFEKFAQVGLVEVYHLDPTRAVSWAIGFHLLSFIPITVIGAWYFSRLGISLGDVQRAGSEGGSSAPRTAA